MAALSLFRASGAKLYQSIVFNRVADFDGAAADLAILDVSLAAYRKVEDHRDFFPTIGTRESVFYLIEHLNCKMPP